MPKRGGEPRDTARSRLAAQLRQDITEGRYAPGEKLPSVRQLGAPDGLSTRTVNQALEELAAEGLVTTTPRQGAWVREQVAVYRRGGLGPGDWLADAEASGWAGREEFTVQVVLASQRVAGRALAEWLRLGAAERVVLRQALRYVRREGMPERLAGEGSVFLSLDLVGATELMSPAEADVVEVLESIGAGVASWVNEEEARHATRDEVERFGWPEGMPVIELARVGSAKGGRPVVLVYEVVERGSRLVYPPSPP